MQRFDEHVLLHAQVQSLHRAARAQQRLMGAGLLQLGEAARSGGEMKKMKKMRRRFFVFSSKLSSILMSKPDDQGAPLSTKSF